MIKWCECIDCHQRFFVEGVGGPYNTRCPKHAADRRRKLTKERVRKVRANKKREPSGSVFIVHLRRPEGGSTFCGKEQSTEEVGRRLFGSDVPEAHRYCRRCRNLFFKASGVRLPE